MNPDNGAFEALRRLLALKRHEQPPLGYFDRFPSEVIARIRASQPEAGLGQFAPGVRELQRLWHGLAAWAVLPAAFGAAVCSLLVLGLIHSSGVQAPAVPISERLDGGLYAADGRPFGIPTVECPAFEPSTTGMLPDQASAGIFRDMPAPRNPAWH